MTAGTRERKLFVGIGSAKLYGWLVELVDEDAEYCVCMCITNFNMFEPNT